VGGGQRLPLDVPGRSVVGRHREPGARGHPRRGGRRAGRGGDPGDPAATGQAATRTGTHHPRAAVRAQHDADPDRRTHRDLPDARLPPAGPDAEETPRRARGGGQHRLNRLAGRLALSPTVIPAAVNALNDAFPRAVYSVRRTAPTPFRGERGSHPIAPAWRPVFAVHMRVCSPTWRTGTRLASLRRHRTYAAPSGPVGRSKRTTRDHAT